MAQANLINQAAASNAEAFKRLRDFVCKRNGTYDYSSDGIGWTLHDASYAVDEDTLTANDWIVVKSTGEDTKQCLYFKITYKATCMDLTGYLYWNNSTHTGSRTYGAGIDAIYTPSGASTLWIYGDLDYVWIGIMNGTTPYLAGLGCIKAGDGFYDNTIATSSGGITAGSSVVVTLDAVPATWANGMKLYLWDSVGRLEIVTLSAHTSTTATLTTVASDKAAGCRLAGDLCYWCSQSYSSSINLVSASRSTGAISSGTYSSTGQASSLCASETLNTKRPADPVYASYTNALFGTLPNIKVTNNTGAVHGATYADVDGTNYRLLKSTGSASYLLKEV